MHTVRGGPNLSVGDFRIPTVGKERVAPLELQVTTLKPGSHVGIRGCGIDWSSSVDWSTEAPRSAEAPRAQYHKKIKN